MVRETDTSRRGVRGRSSWPGPFIGRKEELARLRRGMEDALAGTGARAWLLGAAGIGKTRTADELAHYARLRNAAVHRIAPAAFAAAAEHALSRVSAAGPSLVLLDAVEPASAARIAELSAPLARLPALVLCTSTAASGRDADLRARDGEQIVLQGLSLAEVEQLIGAFSRGPVDAALARRAARETGCNPLRLRAWMRGNLL